MPYELEQVRPQPWKLLHEINEVTERTSLGRTLVFELIRSGVLPSVKVGSRRLVKAQDLEAFVSSLVPAEPPAGADAARPLDRTPGHPLHKP